MPTWRLFAIGVSILRSGDNRFIFCMLKEVSKTGTITASNEAVFHFLSDFKNLEDFIPQDKVKDFEATADSCKFSIPGLGQAEVHMLEREPFKTIKLGSKDAGPVPFNFWIQLKELEPGDTRIRLTLHAELNMMIKMMVGKKIKPGLDALIDKMEVFFNTRFNQQE